MMAGMIELTPDDISMLRVVSEAGPLGAGAMTSAFIKYVKAGLIGGDGRLTQSGRDVLLAVAAPEKTP